MPEIQTPASEIADNQDSAAQNSEKSKPGPQLDNNNKDNTNNNNNDNNNKNNSNDNKNNSSSSSSRSTNNNNHYRSTPCNDRNQMPKSPYFEHQSQTLKCPQKEHYGSTVTLFPSVTPFGKRWGQDIANCHWAGNFDCDWDYFGWPTGNVCEMSGSSGQWEPHYNNYDNNNNNNGHFWPHAAYSSTDRRNRHQQQPREFWRGSSSTPYQHNETTNWRRQPTQGRHSNIDSNWRSHNSGVKPARQPTNSTNPLNFPRGVPSYVRNRMSEMKRMIEENDVEVRLDSPQPEGSERTVVWVRRRNISHPSPNVQTALDELVCRSEVFLQKKRNYPVIVIRPGGKRFRARLESTSIDDFGEVRYRDIDSGLLCSVPANSVFRCSPELLAIPPNAWRCQLETSDIPKHVSPKKWTPARIRVIKWNAVPTIRLLSKSDPEEGADDYEDYGHLFDFAESTPTGQCAHESEVVQKLFAGLPGVPLPKGPLALLNHCWAVNVQWPYIHFVQGNAETNALPLDPSFTDDPSLEEPSTLDLKPNSLCMVRIGTRFWRVAVKRVQGKLASVVFVDNGKESVIVVSDLRPLISTQRHIQPSCIKARLPDAYLARCTDESTLTLLAMAAGPLQVVITKFNEDIPVVRLYGTGGREICVE